MSTTIHDLMIERKKLNSAVAKATGKAKSAKQKTAQPKVEVVCHVSDEERQHMIAVNAYYRAKERDFLPGNEVGDWLAAEAEVNQSLLQQKLN